MDIVEKVLILVLFLVVSVITAIITYKINRRK